MRNCKSGLLGLACLFFSAVASGQGTGAQTVDIPDAPSSLLAVPAEGVSSSSLDAAEQTASPAKAAQTGDAPLKQTKRILGIIPNFRSVSVDEKLPPMTFKDKFIEASQDNFDYSSIALPALVAFYDLKTNATPEFGHGGVGYGRYLWHSAVDQTSENYFVEFIVPVATHEDPRYYTLGRGGFAKRTIYSLSRVIVTRSDEGRREFNASEVLGSGMSAALANAYYPSRERSFGNTAKQWGTDIGIDALSMMVKEFWPDINNALFRGKE
jgi:hypothetical protein